MAPPAYLRPYLRALWDQAPVIAELPALPSARAVIGDGLLLIPAPSAAAPASQQRTLDLATAAHAGAHVRYGQCLQERSTLKPVQIALVGLLEDARVELLAASDLPGLRELWLPFHQADQAVGQDVEALFLRLARSLLNPGYDDPHAWVRKGRALFYADGRVGVNSLPLATGLRRAASLLGNDLGQMRLQFNARAYVVQPAYRDDNVHLWTDRVDLLGRSPASDVLTESVSATPAPPLEDSVAGRRDALYPEWDRLIRRLRPDWVTVREVEDSGSRRPGEGVLSLQRALDRRHFIARRLRSLLAARRWATPNSTRRRAEEGDNLHLDAVLAARVALQIGQAPDLRVYLDTRPSFERISVLTMLDASASTARTTGAAGGTLLEEGRLASLLLADALEHSHYENALYAFASNGRHQVVVQTIKRFEERVGDPRVLSRAARVTSSWSTRIGAALRHATATAVASRRVPQLKVVLLVTDGEPFDIDVHDSRYLLVDLRQAVLDGLRHGVRVACINLGAPSSEAERGGLLRSAFAPGAYCELSSFAAFPQAAAGVLRCAMERAPSCG